MKPNNSHGRPNGKPKDRELETKLIVVQSRQTTSTERFQESIPRFFEKRETTVTCLAAPEVVPEDTLRALGIISLTGTYRLKKVKYTPKLKAWVSMEDNTVVRGATMKNVSWRDETPRSVIRIVGSRRSTPVAPRVTAALPYTTTPALQKATPAQTASSSSSSPSKQNAPTKRKFHTEELLAAIPQAARNVGGLVLTYSDDFDEIPKFFNEGVRGMVREGRQGNDTLKMYLFNVKGLEQEKVVQTAEDARNSGPPGDLDNYTHHLWIADKPEMHGNQRVFRAADQYVEELIDELATEVPKGSNSKGRPAVPVVTLLIGGEYPRAAQLLLHSVRRKWPILILEGSGGYADTLVKTRDRVLAAKKDAGMDEFRRYLGTIDPLTAEIINNGAWKVIEKEEAAPDRLAQLLEKSQQLDDMLKKAWHQYATWHVNMKKQETLYGLLQICTLTMGMLATGFAILMTFLLLLWDNEQPSDRNSPRALVVFWAALQWAVIGLPIVISLFQAITNRLNPGAKWVYLRKVAEEVLSEIYFYRTQTGGYAPKEVVNPKSKESEEEFQSRAQLLQQRMEKLVADLNRDENEVVSITMRPYEGELPPAHIRAAGDSGFGTLTPDEYVQVRLDAAARSYYKHAQTLQVKTITLDVIINLCGALGTTLAALAAFRFGSLQAWVSFTTCIVNTLTRYQDYSRVEWMHKKHNKTHQNLRNVRSWWQSLGYRADNTANRNLLVKMTEEFILEEVDAWGQQLQKALAREKRAQKEDRDEMFETLEKSEGYQRALKSAGFGSLTPAKISEAIANPGGPEFKELTRTLGAMAKKLEVPLEVAAVAKIEEVKSKVDKMDLIPQVQNIIEKGRRETERIVDLGRQLLESPLFAPFRTQEARNKFLADLQGTTYFDLLRQASKAGAEALATMQKMPQIQALEVAKAMACDELFATADLDAALLSNPITWSAETFVSEMRMLAGKSLRLEDTKAVALLNLVKDTTFKQWLMKFDTEQREVATQWFRRTVRDFEQKGDAVKRLFEQCVQSIATMHLDSVYLDTGGLALLSAVDDIVGLVSKNVNIDLLSPEDLLQLVPRTLPAKLRAKFETFSHSQLVACIKQLAFGSTAAVALAQVTEALQPAASRGLQLLLEQPRERRERFVLCAGNVNQVDINRRSFQGGSTAAVTKLLHASAFYTEEIEGVISGMSDEDLLAILSHLQGAFSTNHYGRMMNALADQVTAIDVRELIPVWAWPKFICKLKQFPATQRDLTSLAKEQVVAAFGFPDLVKILERLDLRQLQDLLQVAQLVLTPLLQREIARGVTLPDGQRPLEAASTLVLDLLVTLAEADIARAREGSATALMWFVGDPQLLPLLDSGDGLSDARLTAILQQLRGRLEEEAPKEPLYRDTLITSVLNSVALQISERLRPQFLQLFATDEEGRTAQAKRSQFVTGVSHFLTLDIAQLDSNGELEKQVSTVRRKGQQVDFTKVLGVFPDEADRLEVIRATLSVVQTTIPHLLFQEVANTHKTFDLCNVIPFSLNRQKLAPLVVELMAAPLGEDSPVKRLFEVDRKAKDVKFLCTRSQLLSVISRLSGYDALVSDLRFLPEQQLQSTLCAVAKLLSFSTLGALYYEREAADVRNRQAGGAEQDRKKKGVVDAAICLLKLKVLQDAKGVATALDDFRTDVFMKRPISDRKRILSHFLDNTTVDVILEFDLMRLESFFAHLRWLAEHLQRAQLEKS